MLRLAEMPDNSVHCVVTSPPYWGLRDYGTGTWSEGRFKCDHVRTVVRTGAEMEELGEQYRGGGKKATVLKEIQYSGECPMCGAVRVDHQIGLEASPQDYLAKMTAVFREVRRVLRADGTCWVNMGDGYSSAPGQRKAGDGDCLGFKQSTNTGSRQVGSRAPLKPKDLIGMPWRLAFALQEDGWWLRQDIIWSKPNPMPESVTDRCTKAHEYLFLLTKSARYFYDQVAIKEPANGWNGSAFEDGKNLAVHPNTGKNRAHSRGRGVNPKAKLATVSGWATGQTAHCAVAHNQSGAHPKSKQNPSFSAAVKDLVETRNKRTVWEIATEPFSEAHFATFPTKLVEPCIRAGCPPGGTVLDPFSGSGTTGLVALAERCQYVGIELNPEYVAMSERRLSAATAQAILL